MTKAVYDQRHNDVRTGLLSDGPQAGAAAVWRPLDRTPLGVTPKACLKVRLKCATSLKPHRNAMSVTVW